MTTQQITDAISAGAKPAHHIDWINPVNLIEALTMV